MPDDRPLLAVLIDADNTSPKWAKAIFDEIAGMGEASVRRVYGDFSSSQMNGWAKVQAEFGLVPHHQPANTVGKNASDIALVIDAMDLLHTGRFDGFILVSSDSDFTRLASRIREQGYDVFGIGAQKTPEAFRKACKRFIFLENLEGAPQQKQAAKSSDKMNEARDLIFRAMDALETEDDWYALGPLGQQVATANPDFDVRSYGFRKFSDLVGKIPVLETRRGSGNQLQVRRVD